MPKRNRAFGRRIRPADDSTDSDEREGRSRSPVRPDRHDKNTPPSRHRANIKIVARRRSTTSSSLTDITSSDTSDREENTDRQLTPGSENSDVVEQTIVNVQTTKIQRKKSGVEMVRKNHQKITSTFFKIEYTEKKVDHIPHDPGDQEKT